MHYCIEPNALVVTHQCKLFQQSRTSCQYARCQIHAESQDHILQCSVMLAVNCHEKAWNLFIKMMQRASMAPDIIDAFHAHAHNHMMLPPAPKWHKVTEITVNMLYLVNKAIMSQKDLGWHLFLRAAYYRMESCSERTQKMIPTKNKKILMFGQGYLYTTS